MLRYLKMLTALTALLIAIPAFAGTVYMLPPGGIATAPQTINQRDGTKVAVNANGTFSITDAPTVASLISYGWQVVHGGSTAPGVGTCTGSTVTGNDTDFAWSAATGTSCVFTFRVPYTATPTACLCNDTTSTAAALLAACTTTTVTVTQTTGHSGSCHIGGY